MVNPWPCQHPLLPLRFQGSIWLFPEVRLCMEAAGVRGQFEFGIQTRSVGQGRRAAGRAGFLRSLAWEAEVIPGQGLGLPEAPGAHRRTGV